MQTALPISAAVPPAPVPRPDRLEREPGTADAVQTPATPAAEPDYLYEIVDGKFVEIPRMGVRSAFCATLLSCLIGAYAKPRKLGVAMVEVLFQMTPGGPARRPDLAFVSRERRPANWTAREDPLALETVPDIAVDFISPTYAAAVFEERMLEYFAAGVRSVWRVHATLRRIYVYDGPKQVRIYDASDTLDAGPVLAGLKIDVKAYFDEVDSMGSEN
jgi:Uma2 family endonuclease